jgi:hypothetical protein
MVSCASRLTSRSGNNSFLLDAYQALLSPFNHNHNHSQNISMAPTKKKQLSARLVTHSDDEVVTPKSSTIDETKRGP